MRKLRCISAECVIEDYKLVLPYTPVIPNGCDFPMGANGVWVDINDTTTIRLQILMDITDSSDKKCIIIPGQTPHNVNGCVARITYLTYESEDSVESKIVDNIPHYCLTVNMWE